MMPQLLDPTIEPPRGLSLSAASLGLGLGAGLAVLPQRRHRGGAAPHLGELGVGGRPARAARRESDGLPGQQEQRGHLAGPVE